MSARRRKTSKPQPGQSPAKQPAPTFDWRPLLLVVVATALTFARVLWHEFTNWDDPANVAGNQLVLSPTWQGLVQVWSKPLNNMYSPLVFTSYMLDSLVGGGKAWVFHLSNLLLHLGSATAVYFLLLRLPGITRPWAAAAGALLFALHPLQAEPVSWVTGRKDVLAGFLGILAMLLYVYGSSERPRFRWVKAGAFLAFILALFAKATVSALPLALLVLDVCVRKKPLLQSAVRLLPWFAAALVFSVVASAAQPMPDWLQNSVPTWKRPLLAGYAFAFYAGKTLFPFSLAPVYTANAPEAAASLWSIAALVFLVGVTLVAAYLGGRIAAVYMMFVAPLLPVLGFVPFLYQQISLTADRYMYLSLVGLAMGAAWLLQWTLDRGNRQLSRGLSFAVAALVVLLGVLCWKQVGIWRSSERLWAHAVRVSPGVPEAHTNLAYAMHHAGRLPEAEKQLELAVKADPDFLMAWNLLGPIQLESRGPEAALPALQEAVRATEKRGYKDSRLANALNNLGVALMETGKSAEARAAFRRSMQISPTFEARQNLSELSRKSRNTTGSQSSAK